jgi:peptide methionine sulfoxide reductase MsrA
MVVEQKNHDNAGNPKFEAVSEITKVMELFCVTYRNSAIATHSLHASYLRTASPSRHHTI